MSVEYSARYSHARLVLTDSTAPVAFGRVGACDRLLRSFGDRLLVVRDVHRELLRKANAIPNLRSIVSWLESDEAHRIHDLTPAHVLDVGDFVRNYQTALDHPEENIGEVATVFAAIELRDANREPFVCMDDQLGKKLCRQQSLLTADTPELLVEMVCEDLLDIGLGGRIWREGLFPDRRELWPVFKKRVEVACGREKQVG